MARWLIVKWMSAACGSLGARLPSPSTTRIRPAQTIGTLRRLFPLFGAGRRSEFSIGMPFGDGQAGGCLVLTTRPSSELPGAPSSQPPFPVMKGADKGGLTFPSGLGPAFRPRVGAVKEMSRHDADTGVRVARRQRLHHQECTDSEPENLGAETGWTVARVHRPQ